MPGYSIYLFGAMQLQKEPEAMDDIDADQLTRKQRELRLFLILTIVLAPVISVALIGTYGFIIWFSQILAS